MTKPKEIVGELYFSAHEPHIIGHLRIGNAHFELAGIRRSSVRTDLTGRRQGTDQQQDLFEEK
jgi:hypothetical protein